MNGKQIHKCDNIKTAHDSNIFFIPGDVRYVNRKQVAEMRLSGL